MKKVKKTVTRKPVRKSRAKKSPPVAAVVEQHAVAEREAVRGAVSDLRSSAARMLDLFAYEAGQLLKDGTTPLEGPPMRPLRGAVDAPGKKHRKPPPQEKINKRLGEKVGKKVGQKGVKNGPRRGRG